MKKVCLVTLLRAAVGFSAQAAKTSHPVPIHRTRAKYLGSAPKQTINLAHFKQKRARSAAH